MLNENEVPGAHEGSDSSHDLTARVDSEDEVEETAEEDHAFGMPSTAQQFGIVDQSFAGNHDRLADFGCLVAGNFVVRTKGYFFAVRVPADRLNISKMLQLPMMLHQDLPFVEIPNRYLGLLMHLADHAGESGLRVQPDEGRLALSEQFIRISLHCTECVLEGSFLVVVGLEVSHQHLLDAIFKFEGLAGASFNNSPLPGFELLLLNGFVSGNFGEIVHQSLLVFWPGHGDQLDGCLVLLHIDELQHL
jgi:hypothetical protein